MAGFTITRPEVFPAGTSVSAYPRGALPPGASAPSGSPLDTQAADSAKVVFSNLADDREYIAAAQVNGVWRMVMFRTDPAASAGGIAKPSAGTPHLYVAGDGSDANDGLLEGQPKASVGAAIAALKTVVPSGGGKLTLGPGQLLFTSEQLADLANVEIEGAGYGITRLVFTGGPAHNVRITGAGGVKMRRLTIDGSGMAAGSGVYALYVDAPDCDFERVEVIGNNGAAFTTNAAGFKWFDSPSSVRNLGATDWHIARIKRRLVSGSGGRLAIIQPGSHRGTIEDCTYYSDRPDNTTTCAIEVQASDDVTIKDNDIEGCPYHGIFFNGQLGICNRAHVIGNDIRRPGRNRTDGDGTVSCIQLNNVQDGDCADNYCRNPPGYGIFGGGSDGLTVTGTAIRDNHIFTSTGADPGIALRACEKFDVEDNVIDSATYGITLGEAPGDAPVNHSRIVGNTFRGCPWGGVRIRGSCHNEIAANVFADTGYDNTLTGWAAAVIYIEADGGTHPTLTRAKGGSVGNKIRASNEVKRTVKPANATLNIPRYFVRSDGPNTTHPIGNSRGNIVEYPAAGWDGLARGIVPAGANPASMIHQCKLGPGDFAIAVPTNGRPHSELILDLATGGSGGAADATTKVGGVASWRFSAAANATAAVQFALSAAWKTGGATPLGDLPDDAFFELAVLIDATAANFGSARLIRFAQGSGDDTNVIAGSALTVGYFEAAGTWQILRARKGDLALNGTATWDNVNWLRPQLVAGSAGALAAYLQNLGVVRTG